MRISSRGDVPPFIAMDVMEAARREEGAGRSIIHMEVGQPGTPAPENARKALLERLGRDSLGYTVGLGLPELRKGIASLYRDWYGLDVPFERVIVTAGSSAGFVLAFTALFDAGARVAVSSPGYPSYRNTLKGLGLEAVDLPAGAESRYQPSPEQIAGTPSLDGLLVASPANPTGSMLGKERMREIIGECAKRRIALISDEIYHGLHYGERAVSALELTEGAVVINSFSKYFSMTGWRVGWMVVPEYLVRAIERLAQNFYICPAHASQVVALGALESVGELEGNRAGYARNRELMLEGLANAGFSRIAPPDGAFYIYADVSEFTDDSGAFAGQLLREAGVAVTPGLDFDPARGHQTMRFSYAASEGQILEGLSRISRFMAGRRGA